MTLDRMVYIKVGGVAEWVRAPDQGLQMDPVNWGSTSQLVNGGTGTVASEHYSRTFRLSWGQVSEDEFMVINRLFRLAGTKDVYYIDRFMQRGNVLSDLASQPYLLAETLSPVAFDRKGRQLARVTASGGLEFLAGGPADGAKAFEENVLVPPGYRATAVANGRNTGSCASFNGIALAPGVASHAIPASGNVVPLRIVWSGTSAELLNVSVHLNPVGASPSGQTWTMGRGAGKMRVVPGSFSVSGKNASAGVYSCTVEVTEVWPWL